MSLIQRLRQSDIPLINRLYGQRNRANSIKGPEVVTLNSIGGMAGSIEQVGAVGERPVDDLDPAQSST